LHKTNKNFDGIGVMTGKIETVGIVGAGQMGGGIAHVSALAGYSVLIYDLSPERIEKGIATINGNLARQVASGKLDEQSRKDAMARISAAPAMADLASADLVIEAATEDETVKRKIYAQLCPQLIPRRSSPPTPRRFRSRALPRRPIVLSVSSASTS